MSLCLSRETLVVEKLTMPEVSRVGKTRVGQERERRACAASGLCWRAKAMKRGDEERIFPTNARGASHCAREIRVVGGETREGAGDDER